MILSILNFPTPIYLLKHLWCRNSSDLISLKAPGLVSLKKTSKLGSDKHTGEASIATSMMCAHRRCDSLRSRFLQNGGLTRLLVQDNWTYSHYLVQMFVHLRCENNEKLSVTKYLPANLLQMDDTYLYQTEDAHSTFRDTKTPLVVPYVLMSNSLTPSVGPIWDSYVELAVKMYDADRSNGVVFLQNSSYGMFDLELTGDLKLSDSLGSISNGSISNGSISNGSISNGSISNGSISNGSISNTKSKLTTSCKTGWKTYCHDPYIGTRNILTIFTLTAFPSWQIASHMPLWTLVPRCDLGISHMPKPIIVSQESSKYTFVFETEIMSLVSQLGLENWFFHINNSFIKFAAKFMTHLSSLNGSSAKTQLVQTTCLPKVTPSVRLQTGSEAEGFLFLPLGLSPTQAQMRLHLNELRQCIRLARTSTQSNLIEKLTPWIRAWKDYYTFPDFLRSQELSAETQSAGSTTYRLGFAKQANISLFKMLWRWACRRHPKKNRQWIKSKYFHRVKEKKGTSHTYGVNQQNLTKKVIFSVCQASGTYCCLPSH